MQLIVQLAALVIGQRRPASAANRDGTGGRIGLLASRLGRCIGDLDIIDGRIGASGQQASKRTQGKAENDILHAAASFIKVNWLGLASKGADYQ